MSGGAFPADDLVRPCEGFPPTLFARQLRRWSSWKLTRCMWRLGPVRWFCLSQSTVD
ncbi:unnamed protein product [Brassica rapa]|uniref:Uncharacterized protein n=1 Tax=Brassica campestris TaxID=3711 RepID=A0A3P6AS63_BRACM|nr:unnamed protein product [Brassica rapa]VDC90513.1 unnamed protein product [Brassica rapa]